MSGSEERERHGGTHDVRKRQKAPAAATGSGDADGGIELLVPRARGVLVSDTLRSLGADGVCVPCVTAFCV